MRFFKYLLLLILITDLLLAGFFGLALYKINIPLNLDARNEFKSVKIENGIGAHEIGQILNDQGIIGNPVYFMAYVRMEGKSGELKAGDYNFSPSMSIKEITDVLIWGEDKNTRRVTIPEGFTKEQIAERLEAEAIILDKKEFLNVANLSAQNVSAIYDFVFLNGIKSNSLEGFLFPDTYEFNIHADPRDVIEKFLANFEAKSKDAGMQSANIYDMLILASLLEKEVQTEEDMKTVAGILNNRLEIGMALQVDATLAYITGKKTGEITAQDKLIDSPYNTYKYRGLPPAPISNPGLKAINSALNPTPNDYLYYLSGPDGTTYFARTLDEHNENKVKYLR